MDKHIIEAQIKKFPELVLEDQFDDILAYLQKPIDYRSVMARIGANTTFYDLEQKEFLFRCIKAVAKIVKYMTMHDIPPYFLEKNWKNAEFIETYISYEDLLHVLDTENGKLASYNPLTNRTEIWKDIEQHCKRLKDEKDRFNYYTFEDIAVHELNHLSSTALITNTDNNYITSFFEAFYDLNMTKNNPVAMVGAAIYSTNQDPINFRSNELLTDNITNRINGTNFLERINLIYKMLMLLNEKQVATGYYTANHDATERHFSYLAEDLEKLFAISDDESTIEGYYELLKLCKKHCLQTAAIIRQDILSNPELDSNGRKLIRSL